MTPTETLLDEVRLLFHAAALAGERLHAQERITMGMRGILELLSREGPATVPQMARRRQVTRQHVQELVNSLLRLGLVALQANPAHRRSALVDLVPAGEKTIVRMRARELRFFEQTDLGATPAEVERAAKVVRSVRRALGAAAASERSEARS